MDFRSSTLQEAIGEAARRSSHIQAYPAGYIDPEMFQGTLQFQSATPDKPWLFLDFHKCILTEALRRFVHHVPIHFYLTRQHKALRLFPGIAHSAVK